MPGGCSVDDIDVETSVSIVGGGVYSYTPLLISSPHAFFTQLSPISISYLQPNGRQTDDVRLLLADAVSEIRPHSPTW